LSATIFADKFFFICGLKNFFKAEVLLINMLDHLARTRQEKIQTYTELLNGFVLFSGHHLHLAVQVLLRQTLPYNQFVVFIKIFSRGAF